MVKIPFRNVIGNSMYCMVTTRLDIAIVVGVVVQFSNNLGLMHWHVVKRLFSHIYKGFKVLCCTIRLVLVLRKPWSFFGFCDSNWGGDIYSKRSTTNYVFLLGETTISWASKK